MIRCRPLDRHCIQNYSSVLPRKTNYYLLLGSLSKSSRRQCWCQKDVYQKRQLLAQFVQFQIAIYFSWRMSLRVLKRCWTNLTPLNMASILIYSRQRELSIWKVLQTEPSSDFPFQQLTKAGRTRSPTQLLTTSFSQSLSLQTSMTGSSFKDWYRLRLTDSLRQSKDSLDINSCFNISSLQSQSLGIHTAGIT